ncbi:MAG: tyrosine--tRNA ligase [Promethearchaeota archaeon]
MSTPEGELPLAERLALVRSVGEEVIEEEGQLEWLLANRPRGGVVAYDGFEPSGRIHIAQGLLRSINVNKLARAGVKFIFLVADWHAAANGKFGGDLEVIKKVGEYFVEVWKACDMNLDMVEFRWASDLVKDPAYWELVLKISMASSLKRVLRCTQIMGRSETDKLQSSQILYPLMQAADIFYLHADICQLGLDQRKVNMLAREVAKSLGIRHKPVAIHHHMLMGLNKPPEADMEEIDKKIARKMSKSDPDSAIFMLDSKADIRRKIKKAWCPQGQVDENPVLEYAKYIIFEKFDAFEVKRPEKFGGDLEFRSYGELEAAFASGDLHPNDLKNAVVDALDSLIAPVREHFETDPHAKELAEFVKREQEKDARRRGK